MLACSYRQVPLLAASLERRAFPAALGTVRTPRRAQRRHHRWQLDASVAQATAAAPASEGAPPAAAAAAAIDNESSGQAGRQQPAPSGTLWGAISLITGALLHLRLAACRRSLGGRLHCPSRMA